MKRIYLRNVRKFAIVSDEDHKVLSAHIWHLDTNNSGYAVRTIHENLGVGKYKVRKLYMHSIIMGKRKDKKEIDHINRNKLDNRRENLRFVDKSQNVRNQIKANKRSKTGIRHICWSPRYKRYILQIRIRGKLFTKGFKTLKEAISKKKEFLSKNTKE